MKRLHLLLSCCILTMTTSFSVFAQRNTSPSNFGKDYTQNISKEDVLKRVKPMLFDTKKNPHTDILNREASNALKRAHKQEKPTINADGSITTVIGMETNICGTYDNEFTPFGTFYDDDQNQFLFTAEELKIAGIGAGEITEIGWEVVQAWDGIINNFNIGIKHTDATAADKFEDGFTNVYSGNHTATAGWNTFAFSQSFEYDGTSNLLIKICFDNEELGDNSLVYYSVYDFKCNAYADAENDNGCTLEYERSFVERPNTKFTAEADPNPVPTFCYGEYPLNGANLIKVDGELKWTFGNNASTYDLFFGPKDNMIKVVDGANVSGTEGLYSYSNLDYSSDYEWQVVCHNVNGTTTTKKWNFKSAMPALAPPFTEDFTDYISPSNIPENWTTAGNGTPEEGPREFGECYWNGGNFGNTENGSRSAMMNQYTNTFQEWLISPNFDLSADVYEARFDICLTEYTSSNATNLGSDDRILFLISPDGGETWETLKEWNASSCISNDREIVFVPLEDYDQDNVIFAFWATDGLIDDEADYKMYFDNFILQAPTSCLEPTNLAISNIQKHQATLDWNENSASTKWVIEYGIRGFELGTGTQITYDSSSTPNVFSYIITGLDAATYYDVYIKSVCFDGTYSLWSLPISFCTECDNYAIPFEENFENWTPLCWDMTGGTFDWKQYSNEGVNCALASFWDYYAPNNAVLTTPFIETNNQSSGLQFKWSSLYRDDYINDTVHIRVSDDNGETWTSIWKKGGQDLGSNDGAVEWAPGSFASSDTLALYNFESPILIQFDAVCGDGPSFFLDDVKVFATEFGTVKGKVQDLSNNPIDGAKITIGNKVRYSDSEGNYSFKDLVVGDYSFKCEALGYNVHSQQISLTPQLVMDLDISLTAPELNIDTESLTIELKEGESINKTIKVINNGNGELDWKARVSFKPIGKSEYGNTAYGFNVNKNSFVSFNTNTPGTLNEINETTLIHVYAGDFDNEDEKNFYVATLADNKLHKVNRFTGESTFVADITGISEGVHISGMACDKSTGEMYLSTTNISISEIYKLDKHTGKATLIGTTGIDFLVDIVIDGNSNMYGWDGYNWESSKINMETGIATVIGSLGVRLNYAQGCTYDPLSDQIYAAAMYNFFGTEFYGGLMLFDKETGRLELIEDFQEQNELDAMAFPGIRPTWLTTLETGNVEAESEIELPLHFTTSNLEPGTYEAQIILTSKPDVGSKTINVIFEVKKEVSLEEGVDVNENIKLFPNPTEGLVNITGLESGQIEVYNSLGQILNVKRINASETMLNISGFKPGVYLVKIKSGNSVLSKYIIKK